MQTVDIVASSRGGGGCRRWTWSQALEEGGGGGLQTVDMVASSRGGGCRPWTLTQALEEGGGGAQRFGREVTGYVNGEVLWEATIKIDDDCSVFKPICGGMRQDCVFSDLFNISSKIILRNIKHHEVVRVGGNNINNLR